MFKLIGYLVLKTCSAIHWTFTTVNDQLDRLGLFLGDCYDMLRHGNRNHW